MKDDATKNVEACAIDLLPAVQRIARRLRRRLPSHASLDDLIGAGNLGLVQAMRQYEPREGVSFEAYALCRIRGAMLDLLREADPMTRRERRALGSARQATNRLRGELHRDPTSEEISEACGLSTEDYQRMIDSERIRRAVSLDSGLARDDGAPIEPSGDLPDAETLALARHESDRLATAIDRLPGRMRKVLELCFDENQKLREVATALGVSQTRAHQLRQEAVDRVQKSYQIFSLLPDRCRPHTGGAASTGRVLASNRY